jgi:hypothetical protein
MVLRRAKSSQERSLTGRRLTRPLRVESLESRRMLSTVPYGAHAQDTGEYMLGDVVVTLVLFESNGDYQANTEDWNELVRDEDGNVVVDGDGRTISVSGPNLIEETKDKVREGVDWWKETLANFGDWLEDPVPTPVHSLNFIYDFEYTHNPIDTPYEPIAGTSNEFVYWMEDFLDEAGFATSESLHSDIREFNNAQRLKYDADWAFTILVANDANDMDGRFAPGGSFQYAFAYSGGRFFVAPASRPAASFTHETAHMFWARDEYEYSGGSYTDQRGYYDTQNWNAADNPYLDVWQDSLMQSGTSFWTAYYNHISSESSLAMIGWQDSDADGVFDVLDVPLTLTGVGYYDSAASAYRFMGSSSAQTLANLNSSGFQNDITINEVSLAEYSLDGGLTWQTAENYGSYEVELDLTIPMQPGQEILIRTRSVDSGNGNTVVTSDETFYGNTDVPTWVNTPGIHGFAWYDEDGSGSWEQGESGIPGWTMQLVDQQGQPLQLDQNLDPDDYAQQETINDTLDGVTLSAVGIGVKDERVGALEADTSSTGEHVFAFVAWGINDIWSSDWRADSRELRIDFDSATTTLSIDAVARSSAGYGRLEVYNSEGELLDRYTTGLLEAGAVETMTITRPTADIAYAIATSHMSTTIRLDNLHVGPQSTAVTDSLGAYAFPGLPAGEYFVQAIPTSPWDIVSPETSIQPITVLADGRIPTSTATDRSTDFGGQLNAPEFPFQNPISSYDVDDSGFISPLDALLIINDLNRNGAREVSLLDGDPAPPPYLDVSGDNLISPYDALLVINWLNNPDRPASEPGGSYAPDGDPTDPEGEFASLVLPKTGRIETSFSHWQMFGSREFWTDNAENSLGESSRFQNRVTGTSVDQVNWNTVDSANELEPSPVASASPDRARLEIVDHCFQQTARRAGPSPDRSLLPWAESLEALFPDLFDDANRATE